MTEDVLYLDVDDIVRLHARIFQIAIGAARDRLRDAKKEIFRNRNWGMQFGADVCVGIPGTQGCYDHGWRQWVMDDATYCRQQQLVEGEGHGKRCARRHILS